MPMTIVAVVMLLLLAAFFLFSRMLTIRTRLNGRLAEWTASYHLTDPQVARIRQLELEYHGNGLPFSGRDPGTLEANKAHYLRISLIMSPEDCARFVRVIVEDGGPH